MAFLFLSSIANMSGYPLYLFFQLINLMLLSLFYNLITCYSYLKYDYLLYELFGFEDYLQACFVLSFIHEIIHCLRRKLAQNRGEKQVDTPPLKEKEKIPVIDYLDESWKEFCKSKNEEFSYRPQKEEFCKKEAGMRVEILLFGEHLRVLYHSEIQIFLKFQDYNNIKFDIFRREFQEKRQEIRKKDPPETALILKDIGGDSAVEIGHCALAAMRNLID